MKTFVMLSLAVLSLSAPALADQCQLGDGRSITIDEAGNVTAPAELAGWRLSDKDDASGLEIYKRGSSPREALDVSSCQWEEGGGQEGEEGPGEEEPGDEGQLRAFNAKQFLASLLPARDLGTCFCECDTADGQIVETGKQFEGGDQREQCEATCQAEQPGSKSVCAR